MTVGALGNSVASSQNASADQKKLRGAAQQFEALLIGQMLRTTREQASDDDPLSGEQSGGPLMDMADQQFAQMLASQGGLGLTQVVIKGFEKPGADKTVRDV